MIHPRRPLGRLLLLLLLPLLAGLAAAAGPLAAQSHPNFARGVEPGKAYQGGDLDSVNLFNGSLTVAVPLGGGYAVGDHLSYGLVLSYSTGGWIFREECQPNNVCTAQVVPDRRFRAGFGWTVSLGEMAFFAGSSPSAYRGPDGSDHGFYDTLRNGDTATAGVWYTRDNTYLRFLSATRTLEFPDGTRHTFDSQGRLTRMEDRFGNHLAVNTAGNPWVLTDSQGRRHEVHFKAGGTADFPQVIDRVDLEAPRDTAGNRRVERYLFEYQPTTLRRPFPHNDNSPALGLTVTVPLLAAVKREADLARYETLGYHTDWTVNNRAPGALKGLRLPTLGRLEWDYTLYQFPTGSASAPNDPKRRILINALGVAERRVIDPLGGTTGKWRYNQNVVLPPAGSNEQPVEATNEVVDPLGHRTVHYFSVFYEGLTTTAAKGADYARPYTVRTTDGTTPPRYLSAQVFHQNGTLLRTAFLRHERDEVLPGQAPNQYQELNSRVVAQRTNYDDDGNRFATTTFSGFDGLGHYRTATTGGNFGAGDVRTTTVTYNPLRGIYLVDPATGLERGDSTFTMLPAAAPWILGTYGEESVSEGGHLERALACFDPLGFQTRRRALRHPAKDANDNDVLQGNDLLTVYVRNAQGNRTGEQSHGGDGANVPTANPCGSALPAAPFSLVHTYQSGVRATSQWAGTTSTTLDRTIDPGGRGVASSSRDGAGLQTDYEHDIFGRVTWEKPAQGHGSWIESTYTPAAGSAGASVYVRRRANNGTKTAPVLAESETLYDGFGRVWRERELLPAGWSTRETRYDGAGNRIWLSEWQAGTPGEATQLFDFDPFGRPGRIQPPDTKPGTNHDTTLNYAGVRRRTRTVRIATTFNESTGAVTEESAGTTGLYDRQGRLWKVTEPSGAGGADVMTTYTYDAGDRLRSVSTPAGVTQARTFDYDALGLLRSETHPEKGAAVTYGNYNALGRARQTVDGGSNLTVTFDAAGRTREVRETGGRLLKEFAYGTSNGDLSNGKLVTAKRHNYVGATDALITTSYQYLARDGRVSSRETALSVNGVPRERFRQTYNYTALGNVNDLTYPVCTHADCQPAALFFADVSATHFAKVEIEAIRKAGITGGCGGSPPNYCPDNNHSRAQMAVFLLVAKEGAGYQPPACTVQPFADVPCSHPFAAWIAELANRGITGGCGGGNFCPNNPVSHGQMAVFLLATREGMGYTPPACTAAPFGDVPCSHPFAPFIQEIKRRGIWGTSEGCATGYCPNDPVTRGQMAVLLARTFDLEVAVDPLRSRILAHGYTNGRLDDVAGFGNVLYHLNGMVSEVRHDNGVTDTQAIDPDAMRRPAAISSSFGSVVRWSAGPYEYDGVGNVRRIGNARFVHDKVSRLSRSRLFLAPAGNGAQRDQSYTFDPFGNLTAIAGHGGRTIPVDPATNRLNGTGTSYDTAGNLLTWNGATYEYDAFHQMIRMASGAEDWRYAYSADDERVWMLKSGGTFSRWMLRDLDGKVLCEYVNDGGAWRIESDYVYRDGQLLAAETARGPRHYHLDHLGTPRLITDRAGSQAAYHVYYPFGEEATAFAQDAERLKFTGHERDLASLAGAGDDLDYMHARHYSPLTGRFTSTDTVGGSPRSPQSWNRYAYVMGRVTSHTDPSGLFLFPAGFFLQATDSFVFSEYINVYGADPGYNYYTGVGGLNSLIAARTLPNLVDQLVRDVRAHYQNRFEQQAVAGNHFAAYIDYFGLEYILPQSGDDLAFEAAMTFIPGGRAARGLTKSFKHIIKTLGIDPIVAGKAIHAAKEAIGRGPADNLLFDASGNIISPETGEIIGHLSDRY